jgi:uncharacterized protein YjiS (DUF1127 family)
MRFHWAFSRVMATNLHELTAESFVCASQQKLSSQSRQKMIQSPFAPNFPLLMLCIFRLAAAQHCFFSIAVLSLFSMEKTAGLPAGITEQRKKDTMFAALVRFIQEWKRYNQSLNELSRLGDRELADIGISRSDIPRVAWNAAHRG